MAKKKKAAKGSPFAVLLLPFFGFVVIGGYLWVLDAKENPPIESGYHLTTLTELGNFHIEEQRFLPGSMGKGVPPPTPVTIPEDIQALSGGDTVIPGYMMPYDMDQEGVKRFLLVRSVMVCCFGQPPRLNEIVMCAVPSGERVKSMYNIPVRVYGKLSVGEVREYGRVLALYTMEVKKVQELKRPDASMQPLPPGMRLPRVSP